MGLISIFIPTSFFIAFALAYFLSWALFLPELRQRSKAHSYRFSTLRLIFFLTEWIEQIPFIREKDQRWSRDLTVSIFSIFFWVILDFWGIFGFALGIMSFELWFIYQKNLLGNFPHIVDCSRSTN